jgi:hypothetical protein
MQIRPRAHTALFILAGVMAGIGTFGLFLTVHAEPSGGPRLECGSALSGTRTEIASDARRVSIGARASAEENGTTADTSQKVATHVTACDTAISTRRTWAWPITGTGLLGLVVLVFLAGFVSPPPSWWGEFQTKPPGNR